MASPPPSRSSGMFGWPWPSREPRDQHTRESFSDCAPRSGPTLLRLSICVWRVFLLPFLLLVIVVFSVGLGYQTRARLDLEQANTTCTDSIRNETEIAKVIDMNCSTNQVPATYIPRLRRDSIFSIYCSRDISTHDLFDIITPDFEACMDSCSNQRHIATGTAEIQQANQSSLSRPCEAVSFVPQLLNTTLALELGFRGKLLP
ncbi:hypothetical protein V8F33_011795 [Rhypophila sp. PSN 637]